MTSKRCPICVGTGEIMGGGMMMKECHHCDGLGKVFDKPVKTVVVPEVDRRSKSYKESIAKIMASEDVSRDEAVKMFDEEFSKI